jgi:hypothetical protein
MLVVRMEMIATGLEEEGEIVEEGIAALLNSEIMLERVNKTTI